MADPKVSSLGIKLLIAGEFYASPKYYLDLISELKLNDRVILRTEFIPNNQVRDYFCAADLLAQPYKHATQSGVTQISYHFDRPMLVTAVGALPEMVAHGKVGYVVPPDPALIADSIVDFYSNHREESLQQAIRIEKEKYSWQKFIDAIFSLPKFNTSPFVTQEHP